MNLGLAEIQVTDQAALKEKINRFDKNLELTFSDKLEVCKDLSRVLVSFQGNKLRPSYRWYKFKEGFSASLIDYFLNENNLNSGTILDPFAGSGTTLFVAGELKGGIDPAGADEHWKTARTALIRIESAFAKINLKPKLFFVGSAIERKMAAEIWIMLEDSSLTNVANLTNELQLNSLVRWLCGI